MQPGHPVLKHAQKHIDIKGHFEAVSLDCLKPAHL